MGLYMLSYAALAGSRIIFLKGDSYRLKGKHLEVIAAERTR